MDKTPEQIAAELTKGERAVMSNLRCEHPVAYSAINGRIRKSLFDKRLLRCAYTYPAARMEFTEHGLAVRAMLQQENNND